MIASVRVRTIGVALVVMAAAGGPPASPPSAAESGPFRGACYCRAGTSLECTASLTERDCRQRCDEALCDDWFWKERLPCWNWGYGG